MLHKVWKWAGKQRKSDKSIGVPWQQVPTELSKLLADTDFWTKNGTFPWHELGVRFHHRLVIIHAFPNGNGRHARLMTNVLLETHGQPTFSWGEGKVTHGPIETAGAARTEYIEALREADNRQYNRLINFVKT